MAALSVNGEAIEYEDIRREATAMLKLMVERMPAENSAALQIRALEWAEENLIEAALLRQSASGTGETTEKLIERITAPASPPRHKDVVAYYLKHRNSFDEPEKIRAAHIIRNVDERNTEADALAAIERARDELAAGRPFGEVADELSDCPGKGGDLGFFGPGEMVPAFERQVFPMGIGQVSPVFRTEFGFHIATVLERRPAGIRKLEEVRSQIEEYLLREKKQKRLEQYVDNLKTRAVIRREAAVK